MITLSSCSYDDSLLLDKIRNHEARIAELETLCNKMNTNISSLQTIIEVIQGNDYVTGVTPITENGKEIGYTISFTQSGTITIYHGQGGISPIIGVKMDMDNVYYWTLNGDWLLDESGQKIEAIGNNGKDGITPLLKIEEDNWYISYDNGQTYNLLGGGKR